MSEWQSIETAPKDGGRVLLGRFVDGDKFNGHVAVDFWRSREKGDTYEGFGQFNAKYWPPTHWMPLPAPPKESNNV